MEKTREKFFQEIYKKDYFISLMKFLDSEYKTKTIYPPRNKMWNAFRMLELDKIKVVILGQDPYPNPNQAMGLSFSVPDDIPLPPSLINIYKEISLEYEKKFNDKGGDLTYLVSQGVLLLNPILTVVAHQPLSHKIKEYDLLFKDIMNLLNSLNQPIVFMLWGNNAKKYSNLLNNPKHLVIKTNHPSPLSANRGGWFYSNCFRNCNSFLKENNIGEINWLK